MRKLIQKQFGDEIIDVIFDKDPVYPPADYPPVKTETVILKKGSHNSEPSAPLPCDMYFDRDAVIELRDGVCIFANVFRPVTEEKVPAIVAYSPYGKHINSLHLPWGVDDSALSGLQKQEGPDPGFWVPNGYAIVNPDARGVFFSQGDNVSFGSAEAEQGYDVVEWAAAQPWCNGRVVMAGNSYLAVAQFLTASLNPPHLVAIAPWEGFTDCYRHTTMSGGIPNTGFQELIDQGKAGFGFYENVCAMAHEYPEMNGYWEDKVTKVEKITVPAYVVGSYVSKFHTYGTMDAFNRMPSENKWLRIHNTHEWPDQYEYQEDLKKFFDYFVKGVDNDWMETPRVRISVLNRGGEDIVNRPDTAFPPAGTELTNLYLTEDMMLSPDKPEEAARIEYCTDDRTDQLLFELPLDEATETTGYFGAHLWVETEENDDLDLFVYALKMDADGTLLPPLVFGAPNSGFEGLEYFSPCGRLRASLRQTDPERSTESMPYQTFRVREPLTPGVPVRVDIPLWPVGMLYEAGQKLVFIVSSYEINKEEWPDLPPAPSVNKGKAFIHTGGDKASYITVPFYKGGK